MTAHSLDLHELTSLLAKRPGLLFGLGLSLSIDSQRELLSSLSVDANSGGIPSTPTDFRSLADRHPVDKLAEIGDEWLRGADSGLQLNTVAKVRWPAILSASVDSHFEDHARRELSNSLYRRQLAVVTSSSSPPPSRSRCLFRLFGSREQASKALSLTGYLRLRSQWRLMLRTFADEIRGGDVICLGMASTPWVLDDLISEMHASEQTHFTSLVFSAAEQGLDTGRLRQLLPSSTQLHVVDLTAGELVREMQQAEKNHFTAPLATAQSKATPAALERFGDLAILVNSKLSDQLQASDHTLLCDLLFSPKLARWEPYYHNLDFARSVQSSLREEVERHLAISTGSSEAVVLRGDAATGKTTCIKRLAFELATSGKPVLWMRPWTLHEPRRALVDLFKTFARIEQYKEARLLVVLDDPLVFGLQAVHDVAAAARIAKVAILLCLGVQTSEWDTVDDPSRLTGDLPVVSEFKVDNVLDADEYTRLPAYLTRLRIASSEEQARSMVKVASSQTSQDVLSTLYYLLPATQDAIAESIKTEYIKLGDRDSLRRVVIGHVEHGTDLLQRAYALVAVAQRFQVPLPVEVLVSALGVSYADWLSNMPSTAWGLLYQEEDEELETVLYRTRNNIVARIIADAVNGGVLERRGELQRLAALLTACDGASPAYREFCVRILVHNDQFQKLDYQDGLELYDKAIAALPFPDRTLKHHRGIWIRTKGRDALGAIAAFEDALDTPAGGSPSVERDEAIHTSIASAIVDAYSQKKLDAATAKDRVRAHLDLARNNWQDLHAIHVHANAMIKLAAQLDPEADPDYNSLMSRALADLDQALLLADDDFTERGSRSNSLMMLERVRDELLMSLHDTDVLLDSAERAWIESKRQDGFALISRKLLSTAQTTGKGKDFLLASESAEGYIRRVEEDGSSPSRSLLEVAIHIRYKWIKRYMMSAVSDDIDWQRLEGLCADYVKTGPNAADPLVRYVRALALCHLDRWMDAGNIFTQIREMRLPADVLWAPRDYLMTAKGGMRRVNGKVSAGAKKTFVTSDEIDYSVQCTRRPKWPKDGEPVSVYVRFQFGGPEADLDP